MPVLVAVVVVVEGAAVILFQELVEPVRPVLMVSSSSNTGSNRAIE